MLVFSFSVWMKKASSRVMLQGILHCLHHLDCFIYKCSSNYSLDYLQLAQANTKGSVKQGIWGAVLSHNFTGCRSSTKYVASDTC